MSSTLIELPPELQEAEDSSTVEYVEATSVEEFAHATHIDDENVLKRVLLPGREFGPYRILGFIASGGMGEIYAAERKTTDGRRRRPVALKVIGNEHVDDWRIVERFKREAAISKAIDSPNVIRVYEFGETDSGDAFLAMELLAGEELFERLCRTYTLPIDDLADIALEVLSGLGDVHRCGFIHRDIKPENIFLARQPDGTEISKILDFGIAKRRDEKSDPLLSVAGQIYGTPQYLAPEQAIDPDVDPRADIYSMGVLLYEAISGSLPFEGESSYDVIVKHQNKAAPRLPSSVDPEFAEIIYTALAKNPLDRFQTADEMASVIRRWRDQSSWAEEIPGADTAFEDVFDTADFGGSDLTTSPGPSPSDFADPPETSETEQQQRKNRERRPRQQINDLSSRKTNVHHKSQKKPKKTEKDGKRPPRVDSPIAGLDEISEPQFLKRGEEAPPPAEQAKGAEKKTAKKAKKAKKKQRANKRSAKEKAQRQASRPSKNKIDPTAKISRSEFNPEELKRESEKEENQGSAIASLVTWAAILAILAAVAYTVYNSYYAPTPPASADSAASSSESAAPDKTNPE
ncbi:MAG: serine/threonine-protein kinase [Myxococcota bacterium]